MKTIFKILLVSFFLLVFQFALFAQDSPPPPPAGGQSGDGNVPGGGAPIGSGLTIMLLLGAAYGSKKLLNLNSEEIKNNNHKN